MIAITKRHYSRELAATLFEMAHEHKHENQENYSPEQFEIAWGSWLGLYTLQTKTSVVAFCGIRDYGTHSRIFDRYFVMPEYRSEGLNHAEYSLQMVQTLIDDSVDMHEKIPFFSIQEARKRNALSLAVKKFNRVLNTDTQLHVLPDLYNTAPESPDSYYNEKCWQSVAVLKPYTLDLPRRPL